MENKGLKYTRTISKPEPTLLKFEVFVDDIIDFMKTLNLNFSTTPLKWLLHTHNYKVIVHVLDFGSKGGPNSILKTWWPFGWGCLLIRDLWKRNRSISIVNPRASRWSVSIDFDTTWLCKILACTYLAPFVVHQSNGPPTEVAIIFVAVLSVKKNQWNTSSLRVVSAKTDNFIIILNCSIWMKMSKIEMNVFMFGW